VSPSSIARLRLSALLLIGILLQTTVVPDVRIHGVSPDLMLLIAVCGGLVGGPEKGALLGFTSGLLADLFLQATPLGLSALAYCLIGFTVGALRARMLREGWLFAPLVALVASAAGVTIFVVAGAMVGQTQLTSGGPRALAKIASIVGAINFVLAIPAIRIVARAASGWAAPSQIRSGRSDRTALSR
jgi:rod shape-determining protein MreD